VKGIDSREQLPNDTISRRCESYRLWKIGQLLSKIRLMKKVLFVVKLRLESSLETLYAGTEVSVPEFDLDKALKMSDTELHSYMETILSGSITSEQRQSFLTGFKQKANELASLKMKS